MFLAFTTLAKESVDAEFYLTLTRYSKFFHSSSQFVDTSSSLLNSWGSLHDVVAIILVCDIVVSEFELRCDYVHSGKAWTPLSPEVQIIYFYYCPFTSLLKLTPRKLMCIKQKIIEIEPVTCNLESSAALFSTMTY